ncbi:ORC1-type DNA replication protein [Caldivirga sp.]|uniref:ORC1-type DNA replication protein n=1 Tax=Caldivirga sp. TaxID=2080243 RepID=UPI0025BB1CAC|nr:ORC1-type DNA replication protein [Caldivirga sp.]
MGESSIIRNPAALTPDFIPPRLVDREEQMNALKMIFNDYIKSPGSFYARALLVGSTGTGKTITSLKFKEYASFSSTVRFIYVPCWTHRTLHSAVRHIGESLKMSIPRRGFSSDELLEIIYDYLKDNDMYVVIVLDDVFHIVNNSGADSLGILIRFYDEHIGEHDYHFSLILIDRDESLLDKLDAGARSTLGRNIIKFPPYTKDQIYEILRDRAQEALHQNAYNDEILEMISDVAGARDNDGGRGNAKQAIEILWKAALTAQQQGSRRILPEHVRVAIKNTLPVHIGELKGMDLHEKLFLLAIVEALRKKRDVPYITFGEAEEEYIMLCERYGLRTKRSHGQLWHYLKDMESTWRIIETRLSGKGMRGRTTLISIPYESLNVLAQELTRMLDYELAVR